MGGCQEEKEQSPERENMRNSRASKEEMAKKAAEWFEKMAKEYGEEIKTCFRSSRFFSPNTVFEKAGKKAEDKEPCVLSFLNTDTVSAAAQMAEEGKKAGKTALLNFASYKNPGGGFLHGMMAQEEALCHASALYNILVQAENFYAWNNQNKEKGMYLNRAIYTPAVPFFNREGKEFPCDVITCAAPNYSNAKRYKMVTPEENFEALASRICFVCDIAEEMKVDTLILGAFGCGVFGQDPEVVAELFRKRLVASPIRRAIFAVPGNTEADSNAKAFAKMAAGE